MAAGEGRYVNGSWKGKEMAAVKRRNMAAGKGEKWQLEKGEMWQLKWERNGSWKEWQLEREINNVSIVKEFKRAYCICMPKR